MHWLFISTRVHLYDESILRAVFLFSGRRDYLRGWPQCVDVVSWHQGKHQESLSPLLQSNQSPSSLRCEITFTKNMKWFLIWSVSELLYRCVLLQKVQIRGERFLSQNGMSNETLWNVWTRGKSLSNLVSKSTINISEYRGFQAFHGPPCHHAETYPIFSG